MSDATTETTAAASSVMTDGEAARTNAGYGLYLRAWAVLLVITLAMVFIGNPIVLILGMCLKATIIAAFFMHLKYETKDFILMVALSIVLFSLVLFGLVTPDGLAM